jgi:ABC-type antimicrobial peptide transport system permease subunit
VLLSVIGGLLLFLVVIISGIICIIAGYAPANIAAKMNPVEAIGFSF